MEQTIQQPSNLARLLRQVRGEVLLSSYALASRELRAEDRAALLEKLPRWAACSGANLDTLINRVEAGRSDLVLDELDFWIYQAERA